MRKYELYRAERDKGLTYRQIADKYGCSYQNVAQACSAQKRYFRHWTPSSCVYPNVRKWLNDNEITCNELLRRLGWCCVANNHTLVNNYLSGRTYPRKELIDKFLSVTGLTYEKFFETE